MFKRIRIASRVGLGFALIMAMMGVMAVAAYWAVSKVESFSVQVIKGDAEVAERAAWNVAHSLGLRRFEKDVFLNIGQPAKVEESIKKWIEQRVLMEKSIEAIDHDTIVTTTNILRRLCAGNLRRTRMVFSKSRNRLEPEPSKNRKTRMMPLKVIRRLWAGWKKSQWTWPENINRS